MSNNEGVFLMDEDEFLSFIDALQEHYNSKEVDDV